MIIAAVLVFILTFFALTFLGYVSHWCFHRPWSGRFYKSHLSHHFKLYPPSDFYSDKYRDAGKDNTTLLFTLVFSPLILAAIAITVFHIVPLVIGIIILAEMAIFGAANNSLHDSFHIKKTFWHRFKFFHKLIGLHLEHHKNIKTNYGIFNFTFDRLFKTFKQHKTTK
jgi:sterol desaturase/sphingolipid hydroxylase (fatty acid hydroxylase superfamily)